VALSAVHRPACVGAVAETVSYQLNTMLQAKPVNRRVPHHDSSANNAAALNRNSRFFFLFASLRMGAYN